MCVLIPPIAIDLRRLIRFGGDLLIRSWYKRVRNTVRMCTCHACVCVCVYVYALYVYVPIRYENHVLAWVHWKETRNHRRSKYQHPSRQLERSKIKKKLPGIGRRCAVEFRATRDTDTHENNVINLCVCAQNHTQIVDYKTGRNVYWVSRGHLHGVI